MDPRDLSSRLHDILRDACRVRLPGPGCTAEAGLAGLDAVKAGLRRLIADVGEREPSRYPSRQGCTTAIPEGRIAGTRATVQHRRRTRGPAGPARAVKLDTPRAAAEAVFVRAAAGSAAPETTGIRR